MISESIISSAIAPAVALAAALAIEDLSKGQMAGPAKWAHVHRDVSPP